MKFRERWRLAGVMANEVRFRGYLDSNPASRARVKEEPDKMIGSLKSASRINSFMATMIISVMAILSVVMTWDSDMPGSFELRLMVSFSLFMLFCFAVIIFFFILTTNGFFSSGCSDIPSLMPLTRNEVGNLVLLTFVRVFVTPFIAIITFYPIAASILLGPFVGLIGFLGCLITIIFGITALVAISRWFHSNSLNSPDSKLSAVVRVIASFSVILGMVLVYGIINSLSVILRLIVDILPIMGSNFFIILSPIFPFSFGIIASVSLNSILIPIEAILVAGAASIGYTYLAIRFYRKTGDTLRATTLGVETKRTKREIREIELDIVSPIKAIVKRDLRLAARNIGTGIIFVLPILMLTSFSPFIMMSSIAVRGWLVVLMMGFASGFSGAYIIALMMIDTQGASILQGLPLRTYDNLKGKTAIFMIPFITSILCIEALLIIKGVSTVFLLLIPVIQIPFGIAISLLTGAFIFKTKGGGRSIAVNLTQNTGTSLITVIVSGLIGSIPLVAYSAVFLLSTNHILSLGMQLLISLLVIILATRLAPRMLKD